MFELSDNLDIKKEVFSDSAIYIIDNFYNNPDEVSDYLFKEPAPLHKLYEDGFTYNNVLFEDRRLEIYNSKLKSVINFLSDLVSQQPISYDTITNQARFYKDDFNDYKNCVWWPHEDKGYNGIVYFNKNDNECGTNLYSMITDDSYFLNDISEHYAPWRPKEKYEISKTLIPKYNRLVLFDGYKFPHGMNIINDRYFSDEYRNNQVFFFERA